MSKKQKLELTWIGKEQRPRLEPRILLEDPTKSYHAKQRVTDNDIFDNRLIFGDNLLALKALEQEFAGKVKCVFIDPPYNTGSAFEHYDDGLEHSIWLGLMRDRLEIIRNLMSDDGSLWITIDDNEAHYLKVMCDEIFGRANFVTNAIWQKKYSPQNDAKWMSDNHDHIIVYAKNKNIWRPNLLPRSDDMNARYKNPDNDPRGVWKPADFSVKTYSAANDFPIKTPSGRVVNPPKSRCWVTSETRFKELVADNRIWFGETGNNVPSLKKFLSEVKDGSVSMTVWLYDEVGHNQDAKKEIKGFNETSVFDTPKPEKLLQKVLTLASNANDLVLDSFAGSGTTGAVAHKMGRRWIMVELGEHCHTHIIPRLQKVIDGEDKGGVTESLGWQGGGGFRYYSLAPSLLEKDKWGNWVISKEYNANQLSQALCKLEGFTYAPSDTLYWMQGHSTETDFIYITTQSLTTEQLQALNDDVGSERSLLVLCSAFKGNADRFPNLTVKKIPRAVLSKCEWGHDDYSLNVENLPMAEREEEKPKSKKSKQPTLFDEGEE
ncbi:site-specific DNA-methyltransferase [Nitrosomonas sp. sh817]|uniref:site-specific DNA-methyltransferase n=1 Tax=Nitrosomonas sp. sh817 TaxID=3070658 RepID=UPI0027DE4A60|nr:site-specific DNA-methyltransferase [Nitrosomonas sp. sh817]WMJ07622.1 site-specific DNA-methyltransferase [Nitrosomonas sp. sh817]